MKILALVAGVVLNGCAMSSNGLAKSEVEASYSSAKPAGEVAECISGSLNSMMHVVQPKPDHFIVTRSNGYGTTMARWDVRSTPSGGSQIEFRKSFGIMIGKEKAAECF